MSGPSEKEWARRVVEPYLDEHGPSPLAALPVNSLSRARERGVELFLPHHGTSGTQPAVGIAYLASHSPEEVVTAWIDANEGSIKGLSRSSVTRRIGQQYDEQWVHAWQRCAKAAGLETHQEAPEDAAGDPNRTCPKCGETVRSRRFVKHIRECP